MSIYDCIHDYLIWNPKKYELLGMSHMYASFFLKVSISIGNILAIKTTLARLKTQ